MLLKFCGLRRQENVTLAARLGATHCGFVFHAGSPRCVDAVTVSRLESGDMVRVGVFTGQDSDEIWPSCMQTSPWTVPGSWVRSG